jgi:hypothetical protein
LVGKNEKEDHDVGEVQMAIHVEMVLDMVMVCRETEIDPDDLVVPLIDLAIIILIHLAVLSIDLPPLAIHTKSIFFFQSDSFNALCLRIR